MRARIRKKLLPLLEKQFQPAIVEHLATLASLAREDDQFLDTLAEHFISSHAQIADGSARIAIADLLQPPEGSLFHSTAEHAASLNKRGTSRALSKRVIRQLVATVKPRAGQLTAAHTAEILRFAEHGESGKALQLPGGAEVRRDRDALVFCAREKATGRALSPIARGQFAHTIELGCGKASVRIPELRCVFRLTVIDWPPERRETIDAGAVLDRDRLRLPLVLRNWRPEDALCSESSGKARKLKRLLNDKHVSRWEKQDWPVLTSGGTIAWARGFPVAAEFAPEERTRAVLVIDEEKF
jgi:tRNA(Ile)-lysidine synthase